MPRRQVELHIDELVLRGSERAPAMGDPHRIGAAVEQELARLLSERGVPPGWIKNGAPAHLPGGHFQVAPGSRPEAVGAQIARAVYGALNGQASPRGRAR